MGFMGRIVTLYALHLWALQWASVSTFEPSEKSRGVLVIHPSFPFSILYLLSNIYFHCDLSDACPPAL